MEEKDILKEEIENEVLETEKTAEEVQNEEFEASTEDYLESENVRLNSELTKVSNELEAIKDRLLRVTAEYDNFRKRTVKEKEGIYSDACLDVLKTILPVQDNLERAMEASGSLDDLKKGIEMTVRQFKDSLEKLKVEEISTDIPFDPNFHSAVMHIQDDNYDQNCIVEVFQKGYKREDKVIRYSMVKVAN